MPSLAHVAPGLRRLVLAVTKLQDKVLLTGSRPIGLTYLHTWGGNGASDGVQVLEVLNGVEFLFLEEAPVTFAACRVARSLTTFVSLGQRRHGQR